MFNLKIIKKSEYNQLRKDSNRLKQVEKYCKEKKVDISEWILISSIASRAGTMLNEIIDREVLSLFKKDE